LLQQRINVQSRFGFWRHALPMADILGVAAANAIESGSKSGIQALFTCQIGLQPFWNIRNQLLYL
jgi:hypothetical protein